MSRWGRDLAIAAAALGVGYALFLPATPPPAKPPSFPQYTVASFGHVAPAPQPTPSEATTKAVLTAATIAALIVEGSRRSYHASGKPCACPEDRTSSGRRCGGNSAY